MSLWQRSTHYKIVLLVVLVYITVFIATVLWRWTKESTQKGHHHGERSRAHQR